MIALVLAGISSFGAVPMPEVRDQQHITIDMFTKQMNVNGWKLTTRIHKTRESCLVDNVSINGILQYRNCIMRESFVVLDPTVNTILTTGSNTVGYHFRYPKVATHCCVSTTNGVEEMFLYSAAVSSRKSARQHSNQVLEVKMPEGVQLYVVPAQRRIEFLVDKKIIATYFSRDEVILVKYRKSQPTP